MSYELTIHVAKYASLEDRSTLNHTIAVMGGLSCRDIRDARASAAAISRLTFVSRVEVHKVTKAELIGTWIRGAGK